MTSNTNPNPASGDPLVDAALARIAAALTSAQALHASGAARLKARAAAAQGLLTSQAIASASAQNAAVGAKLKAASDAAAQDLKSVDATTAAASSAFLTLAEAAKGFAPRASK